MQGALLLVLILLVVQLFSQDHTGMAKQTDEAAHVIRTDLIRNQREKKL